MTQSKRGRPAGVVMVAIAAERRPRGATSGSNSESGYPRGTAPTLAPQLARCGAGCMRISGCSAQSISYENTAILPVRHMNAISMANLSTTPLWISNQIRRDVLAADRASGSGVDCAFNDGLGSGGAPVSARPGYAVLKLNGRAHGLEGLRRELGKRFEKNARSKPDVAADAG